MREMRDYQVQPNRGQDNQPQNQNGNYLKSLNQQMPGYSGYLLVIACFAALGGFLFGYDTGVVSGAQQFFKQDFSLTSTMQEVAVSAVLIGAVLGAAIAGKVADNVGRKMSLIIIGGIFAVGAILTAIAPGFWFFVIFRIVVGIAIGSAAVIAPMYATELAPTERRGQMVFIFQFFLTVGILCAYLVDFFFASINISWRWMFAVGMIPGIILSVGMFFLVDTPRWLASKGRWDEARQALQKIVGRDAEEQLQEIRQRLNQAQQSSWRDLLRPGLRVALIIGVLLAIFQQITGINTIIYYTPIIAGYTGIGSQAGTGSLFGAIIVGAVNALATLGAIMIVDRLGRRPLLMIGVGGMAVTLGILGTFFFFGTQSLGLAMFITLLLYIVFFAIGLGPVYWLFNSELFPTRLRGTGNSISTTANWLANFVVSVTFLTLVDTIGKGWTFWLYAFFAIVAWIFISVFAPETKNRPLEKIEEYWESGRSWEAIDSKS
jgi:MFS transporter, SP family, galactose:H+ symporter